MRSRRPEEFSRRTGDLRVATWRQAWRALLVTLGLIVAVGAMARDASALPVALDTSSLAGTAGRFELLLLDLDAGAQNTVSVGNIATDGAPSGVDCTVGCSSGASYTLDDRGGLGQLLFDLTLGTFFRFDLGFTANFAGIPGVDAPDRFALSLLDPVTNFSLVSTEIDLPPSALLTVDLAGSGIVRVAARTDPRIGIAVPEPGTALLVVLALTALASRRRSSSCRVQGPEPFRNGKEIP
jgi:hypothetical protein